jgi:chemotaxis protein MotB
MIPHSTLMLILMILFTALYADAQRKSVEFETALADLESTDPSKVSPARKEITLAKNLKEFIDKKNLSEQAQFVISAKSIKINMSSPVLFASGKADLKSEIMPLLDNLYTDLKHMDSTVTVDGHTDNVPIHNQYFISNWELSAARAFSVIRYFINKGITPERLIAHGYGEYRPIYPNDTETGRAKNRRLEITIERMGSRG